MQVNYDEYAFFVRQLAKRYLREPRRRRHLASDRRSQIFINNWTSGNIFGQKIIAFAEPTDNAISLRHRCCIDQSTLLWKPK
jgi:hypothetical protein